MRLMNLEGALCPTDFKFPPSNFGLFQPEDSMEIIERINPFREEAAQTMARLWQYAKCKEIRGGL